MGFWFWFFTCLGIVLVGLVFQILALVRLARKGSKLPDAASRLQEIAARVQSELERAPILERVEASTFADPATVSKRRAKLKKERDDRKREVQRRLISRLKNQVSNESE